MDRVILFKEGTRVIVKDTPYHNGDKGTVMFDTYECQSYAQVMMDNGWKMRFRLFNLQEESENS